MDEAALSHILQEVISTRLDDVPRMIRVLDNTVQTLKKQPNFRVFDSFNDQAWTRLKSLSVEAYGHALLSAKLARALIKLLRCLPEGFSCMFVEGLKAFLQQLLLNTSFTSLKTLSAMLDQNLTLDLITQDQFGSFTQLLQTILKQEFTKYERGNESSEYQKVSIKLCVQVLRLFPLGIRSVLGSDVVNKSGDREQLRTAWRDIIAALMVLIVKSDCQDVVLLTGTSLAMIFNSAGSPIMTQVAGLHFLSVLIGDVDQRFVQVGDLSLDVDQHRLQAAQSFQAVAALTKGLLVCCDREVLGQGQNCLLLLVLPHILQACQGANTHHYLAFQNLALWFQKLNTIDLKDASNFRLLAVTSEHIQPTEAYSPFASLVKSVSAVSSSNKTFLSQDCQILTKTLSCIWPNWDSPVEGVPELVVEIFNSLLGSWQQAVRCGASDYQGLCRDLVSNLLRMAWYQKSRYKALHVLLRYVSDVEIVEICDKIRADVLMCMRTNTLAAAACDVYQTSLQLLINSAGATEAKHMWTQVWLPTLLNGLTSNNRLQSLKTRVYLLPPTLKLMPSSQDDLISVIEDRLSSASSGSSSRHVWLFAWISVTALVRDIIHSSSLVLTSDLLRESLRCQDEDIRAEALKLVCSSVKRGEPVSDSELRLLREFIPANLKTTSTGFRQSLTSATKKLLVRLRDSCLSAIRNKHAATTSCTQSLQFVDWLYRLLVQNLVPGGCYQRRQTCLGMLEVLLETLVYQPQVTSRKGKAQESSTALFQFAQEQNLWQFFSEDNFRILICCLEDGVPEIQKQAYTILVGYFAWPLQSASEHVVETSSSLTSLPSTSWVGVHCHDRFSLDLFDRALALLDSPKPYENHSGVMMVSLILQRHLKEASQQNSLYLERLPDMAEVGRVSPPDSRDSSLSCRVLDFLVSKLKSSVDVVLENVGLHFKNCCLHGWTQCVTRCLLDIARATQVGLLTVEPEAWRCKLEEIILLNQKIITFVLDVLSGRQNLDGCPSFADMGIVLKNLIAADNDPDDDLVTLTPEFQLLLSWFWLNLKESCSCLGEVTPLMVAADGSSPVSLALLFDVGQTFVKVLTTCRHRGAIEGCRQGLSQFCSSLLSSSISSFSSIPGSILQQVLAGLSTNSISSSVTRRSAGLPIIIQTVIQSAVRSGDKSLLLATVHGLYEVASQPLPSYHNQQQDLCQGHALNILKTIFCDAGLAQHLLPLLSKMTILVVEGFDSQSWAIRNAATQLISTLVARIFGQKTQEDMNRSLSLEDLCSQQPELVQFVTSKLSVYVESRYLVRPSLYVVLTLLTELGMSPSYLHTASSRTFLRDTVMSFSSSPIYALRKLSAQAFVKLSPLDKTDETLAHILSKVQQQGGSSLNELHGWLLAARFLMSCDYVSSDTCRSLVLFVLKNKWLLLTSTACLLPASTLVETVRSALTRTELDPSSAEALWELVEESIVVTSSSQPSVQVDRDHYLSQCVQLLLDIKPSGRSTVLRQKLHQSLVDCKSSTQHVQEALLDHLLSDFDNEILADAGVQKMILEGMYRENYVTKLLQSVNLFIELALQSRLQLKTEDLISFRSYFQKGFLGNPLTRDTVIFLVDTLTVGSCCDGSTNKLSCSVFQDWCPQLLTFSKPTQNEDLRNFAAKSVTIAGKKFCKYCKANRHIPVLDYQLSSLVKAILNLLDDTEEQVREAMSKCISQWEDMTSLSDSCCYPLQAMSLIICQNFNWSEPLVSTLLDLLYLPGHVTQVISSALSSRNQVLFEPEMASPLTEVFVTQIWAYQTLQVMCQSNAGNSQLESKVKLATEDLASNMATLQTHLCKCSIFNISCDPNVISCLLGVICLSSLDSSCVQEQFTGETSNQSPHSCLRELVESLIEIPSMHPFLRRNQVSQVAARLCSLVPNLIPGS